MKDLIHYGNGNHKRTRSACGDRKHVTDSVDHKKVSCIKCIESLLKRQNNPTKNTPVWEDRLATLRKSA